MMRFVSVIKSGQYKLFSVCLAGLLSVNAAQGEIIIEELGQQSAMAEQGSICASFATLMENQGLLNDDLGILWTERRKFAGAVVRRAVEMAGNAPPSADEIDAVINDYREWMLLNLTSGDAENSLDAYQTDLQNLIRTNCLSLFEQADKAILRRFPDLDYLIAGLTTGGSANKAKQAEALLRKNIELNKEVKELRAALAVSEAKSTQNTSREITQETTQETPLPSPPKKRPVRETNTANTSLADASNVPPQSDQTQSHSQQQQPPAKASTNNTKNEAGNNAENNPKNNKVFFAQLGSFSTKSAADQAANEFRQSFPDLFNTITLSVNAHQFASGKTLFRVRTKAAERESITEICDILWQERLGCLIKTEQKQ